MNTMRRKGNTLATYMCRYQSLLGFFLRESKFKKLYENTYQWERKNINGKC